VAKEAALLKQAAARRKRKWLSLAAISIGVLVAVAGVATFYTHRAHALTDKDTVVLADFENKTGDPIFDDALKQGLSVSLSQSPFLNLLSDQRVGETLRFMGHNSGERLTSVLARDVCVRTNSKA